MRDPQSRTSEWRRYGYLPFVAALGYSTASLHSYGIGAFIEPLEAEFGWSRAQVSMGLTIAGISGALFSIPMGMLVDKIGPRRVGMIGVTAMTAAFAMLGTATGSLMNWAMLWTFLALANLWTGVTVWTKAVASRFEKSRGLAFAITLSGAPITATFAPLVATALMLAYDWRAGFIGVGAIWALAVLPAVFLFFRSAQEEQQSAGASSAGHEELPGATVAETLRSPAFYLLLLASILFAFTVVGTTVHFVPILTDSGAAPLAAAGIASLVGIFSFVGRLGTGFLLDRIPAHLLGALICLFPVMACVLLMFHGSDPVSQAVAASFLGLTVGGEIDVIAYLTTRQFGLKRYGVIFGSMAAAMNVGTASGPLVAGAAHDMNGTYSLFLVVTITAMLVSSIALLSLGRGKAGYPH